MYHPSVGNVMAYENRMYTVANLYSVNNNVFFIWKRFHLNESVRVDFRPNERLWCKNGIGAAAAASADKAAFLRVPQCLHTKPPNAMKLQFHEMRWAEVMWVEVKWSKLYICFKFSIHAIHIDWCAVDFIKPNVTISLPFSFPSSAINFFIHHSRLKIAIQWFLYAHSMINALPSTLVHYFYM